MTRILALLAVLFLAAGCADTPDDSWYDWIPFVSDSDTADRAVSADRRIPGTIPSATGTPPAAQHSAATGVPPQRTAAASNCYRGRLTEEGSTCQAMRTDSGGLLTLAGPLRGFGDGDSVCVCGVQATQQFCGQGMTLLVRDIAENCNGLR
ncbi:MAG: hypothetical protein AAF942_01700 [Pseudomonadota bacterium]